MVLDYYSLKEEPFGVTPDTRFLYLSHSHAEALASLLLGIREGRGFLALIAKPGMGKTTILFELQRRLGNSANTVFLFQTQCGPRDFMRNLLADLGCEANGDDFVTMHAILNDFLLKEARSGRNLIVLIDEAQNLSNEVLEVLRMLSNFETPRRKLVQIVLSGQPMLADKLMAPELLQLRQRISLLCHLSSFDLPETKRYITHRLSVAGYPSNLPLFTNRALSLIAEHSDGIPRNINNICFNALSIGTVLGKKQIDERPVLEVLNDLDMGKLTTERCTRQVQRGPSTSRRRPFRLRLAFAAAAAVLGIVAGVVFHDASAGEYRMPTFLGKLESQIGSALSNWDKQRDAVVVHTKADAGRTSQIFAMNPVLGNGSAVLLDRTLQIPLLARDLRKTSSTSERVVALRVR